MYDEMTDFEVNMRVASEVESPDWISANRSQRAYSELVLTYQNGPGCTKNIYLDYCNNALDGWKVISDNRISIAWAGDDEWFARTVHTGKVFNKNPLKAAMIAFLRTKGAL